MLNLFWPLYFESVFNFFEQSFVLGGWTIFESFLDLYLNVLESGVDPCFAESVLNLFEYVLNRS